MQLIHFAVPLLVAPALGEPIPQAPDTAATKPFIPDYNISDICFPGQREQCKGSFVYCAKEGWKAKNEPKQYSSATKCLNERISKGSPNAAPGNKIPYLEAQGFDCARSGNQEICTGSAVFCAASEDESACLAARTPPPDNLAFREPGSCRIMTESCLGTLRWCQMSGAEEEKCVQRRKGRAGDN